MAHCGSSAAPATARLLISNLGILRGMNDMKVEEGMSLNEMGALMYYSVWCMVNTLAVHNIITHFLGVRWSSLTWYKF
jgi:hypothetical protein